MKKISFLIALAVILNCCPAAVAEDAPNYAQAFFDGSPNVNVGGIYYNEGAATFDTVGGQQVLVMGGGPAPGNVGTVINVAGGLFPADKLVPMAITVRYFDKGNGFFTLRYANDKAIYLHPEYCEMTDTKEWKEHTFQIDDFVFRSRTPEWNFDVILYSYHIERSAYTPESVYIQWVKIERGIPKMPILASLTSEHPGNAFDDGDAKQLDVNLSNITLFDVRDVKVEWRLKNFDGSLIKTGEMIDIAIPPEDTVSLPIDVTKEVKDFGCYLLSFYISGTVEAEPEPVLFEGETTNYDFSIVNKRDAGEKSNPMTKVNLHTGHGRVQLLDRNAQMLDEIGISGVREEASLGQLSAGKDVFHTPGFMRYVDAYEERGVETLLCLTRGDWVIPTTEAELVSWRKYVDYVSKTFKGRIKYYEVWNEANASGFNHNGATFQDYVNMTKAAYEEIKRNDPNAIVMGGGAAGVPYGWFEEGFKVGLLDYCDVISFHPYDDLFFSASGVTQRHRNDKYKSEARAMRELVTKYGKPDIPFHFTELGIMGSALPENGSQTAQAAGIVQMFAITAGEKLADSIFYYDFQNDYVPEVGEGAWGMIRHWTIDTPFAAKPSYIAMAGYNKLLSDSVPKDSIVRDGTSAYRFLNRKNNKDVAVLWTDYSSETISLDLGVKEVEVFDIYTNSRGIFRSDNGVYTFQSSFEPMYITGSFTKFEEAEPDITLQNGRIGSPPGDTAAFVLNDTLGRDLDVTVKTANGLTLLENNGIKGGTGVIRVEAAQNVDREQELYFEVSSNGNRIFSGKAHVIITEPVSMSFDSRMYSPNTPNRYIGMVNITNLAQETAISGTVEVDLSVLGGDTQMRAFNNLKPGAVTTIEFNIPWQPSERKTVILPLTVKLDYGWETSFEKVFSKITAAYAEKPPSITGTLDYSEWTGGDWFLADDAYSARYIGGWKGPRDCSVRGKVKWDKDNIYILAVAEDDVWYHDTVPSYLWQVDSFQFTVQKLSEGSQKADFTEIGIARTNEGTVAFRFVSPSFQETDNNAVVKNCSVSVEEQNGKFIYRAAIPWTEIYGKNYANVGEGDVMGFSAILNDNDGAGRRGWVEYTSGIGMLKNTELFGTMQLIK